MGFAPNFRFGKHKPDNWREQRRSNDRRRSCLNRAVIGVLSRFAARRSRTVQSFLTRYYRAIFIMVWLPPEPITLSHLAAPGRSRRIQCGIAVVVLSIDVGSPGEQRLHDLAVTLLRGHYQCGRAVTPLSINVGPPLSSACTT